MSFWLKHQSNQSTVTNKLFIKFLCTYYKHIRKFYYTYTATIFISWNFISSLSPSMPLAAFKLHQVQVTECQVVNRQTKSTAKQWTLLPMFSDPLALVWLYSGHAGVWGNETADKLARDGSVLKFVGPQPALGVSRQDIRTRIRCWLVNQHWIWWRGLGDTQRQTRELISGPCLSA
jgi:hypothetical protein